MKKLLLLSSLVAVGMTFATTGKAAEDASCATVRFANPGWTDILVTTSFATNLLQALGYQTKDITLSTSVSWKSVAEGDVDVFLGNWTPSQDEKAKPYLGKVKIVGTNLVGTRYTMATTKKAYDEGLRTVADLAKFKDKLGGKVYGINPGSSGNTNMMNAIADAKLEGFTLVESSEEGMLTQVQRKKDGYIVFLGWTPHWMNSKFQMEYVGGPELDKYFGKGGGYGIVRTVVNKNFAKKCPNVTKLASNLKFTMEMENSLMSLVGEKKQKPEKVTVDYLKANPTLLDAWLKGVTTKDGGDAVAAVKKSLGM
ncbi:MAG: glycine betaine ABC transporter substrate-binding protein [Hydrotalea sp.]|nr:glycine betaine ABC transporter substrate-binding protein [Hydrotalea sp.]